MKVKRERHFKASRCDIPELKGLKGSKKSMWLNAHRAEIVECAIEFGNDCAREKYGIQNQFTLDRLMSIEPVPAPQVHAASYEALRFEVQDLHIEVTSLRKELRELRGQFNGFQNAVADQLLQKFLLPLIRQGIKIDDSLDLTEKPSNSLDVKYIMDHTRLR